MLNDPRKKLEELTKKIQELVPEIMEPKFGCKFLRTLPSGRSDIYCLIGYGKHDNASFLRLDRSTPDWFYATQYQDFEILGRDIRLTDVLLALDKGFKYCTNCGGGGRTVGASLGVSECGDCGGDGHLYEEKEYATDFSTAGSTKRDFVFELLSLWDFTKPFHQQLPETIDFLHSILCFTDHYLAA